MRLPEMPPARVPDDADTDEFRLGHILDATKARAIRVWGSPRLRVCVVRKAVEA